jgi:hypothetical protein
VIEDTDFEHFIPSLLKDVEIQDLLMEELQLAEGDLPKLLTELKDEAHDVLYDYIQNEAPTIVSLDIDFGDDDAAEVTWQISGLKGVFFTWSIEHDAMFYKDYASAKLSIEHDYLANTVELDPEEQKKVSDRIKEAERVALVRKDAG